MLTRAPGDDTASRSNGIGRYESLSAQLTFTLLRNLRQPTYTVGRGRHYRGRNYLAEDTLTAALAHLHPHNPAVLRGEREDACDHAHLQGQRTLSWICCRTSADCAWKTAAYSLRCRRE